MSASCRAPAAPMVMLRVATRAAVEVKSPPVVIKVTSRPAVTALKVTLGAVRLASRPAVTVSAPGKAVGSCTVASSPPITLTAVAPVTEPVAEPRVALPETDCTSSTWPLPVVSGLPLKAGPTWSAPAPVRVALARDASPPLAST